jgi:hypothetical protein
MESSKQFTIIDDSVLEDKTNKPTTSDLTRNGSLQDVRDAVANLFQNFIMTKTHQQSHHGVYYGIYKAAVDSLSGTGQKYIVAIVPNDQNIRMGSEFLLKTLPWISFQSRVTEQPLQEFAGFRLKPQPYQNQISRTNILFDRIKFAANMDGKHIYIPDHLPLRVEILLKHAEQTFAQEAAVVSAIQLFQTLVILDSQDL